MRTGPYRRDWWNARRAVLLVVLFVATVTAPGGSTSAAFLLGQFVGALLLVWLIVATVGAARRGLSI